jgi:zinc protease
LIARNTLKNGIPVLLVERHSPAFVNVELVGHPPDQNIPNERAGVRFVAASGNRVTARYDAAGLTRVLDNAVADLFSWPDYDAIHVSSFVMSNHVDEILDVLHEMTVAPTFVQGDVTYRKRLAQGILHDDDPVWIADRALQMAVYGADHPYAFPINGRPDVVSTITPDEVATSYHREFHPKTTAIVAAGDISEEDLVSKLNKLFGDWKAKPEAAPQRISAPTVRGPRLVVVDRPGSEQTRVAVGGMAAPRKGPDWTASQMVNWILGGSRSSRLVRVLRQDEHLTYSGYSALYPRRGGSIFTWAGDMNRDATARGLKTLDRELRRIARDGVTADELADAKEAFLASFPSLFTTMRDITNELAHLVVFDLPLDEFETYEARVQAVRDVDARRVARDYFVPDRMTFVVVGDWRAMAASLRELGWGRIEFRDAWGRVLRVEDP